MKRVLTTFLILCNTSNGVIGKFYNPHRIRLLSTSKSDYWTPLRFEKKMQINNATIGGFDRIQSPGYPFNYWPNLECSYSATSPTGTQMEVNCEDFNIESHASGKGCGYDSLLIFPDGNFSSVNQMVTKCGKVGFREFSVSNKLAIIFRSFTPFRFLCTIKVISKQIQVPATPKPLPRKCSCGERRLKRKTRIVKGHDAEVNEFPWRCSLFSSSLGDYCGCAVISENWVVTAAHCLKFTKNFKLNIGDHDHSRSDDAFNEYVSVSKVILHPHYNSKTQDNDLSLVKLGKKLKFTDNIQPVCLPFKFVGKSLQGMTTIATGGKKKDILQKVNLTILETQECRYFAEYSQDSITDNMFCTTYGDGEERDMCQGDSGGGINIYDKESRKFFEVGTSSWGIGCADAKKPGVYTKLTVKKQLEWILQNTGPELCVVE